MTRELAEKYYLEGNYNCAEAVFLAANEAHQLGIPQEAVKLLGAFGAGMGCGAACGALCAGVSVIGAVRIQSKAHETPGLADATTEFVEAFRAQMGADDCKTIAQTFKKPDVRCVETVKRAADLLDQALEAQKNG